MAWGINTGREVKLKAGVDVGELETLILIADVSSET